MKTRLAICFTTVLFAACGCTAPQAITRGQSPHHRQTTVIPATHGNLATTWHPLQDEHAYASSYHSTSGYPGYNRGANCPSGDCRSGVGEQGVGYGHGLTYGSGGAFGHGGYCPGCRSGQGCPHHYHSYAYQRPQDLVYPPANAPGGAVVYPYYTHKGPSDFFRDDPCNCSKPSY